MNYKVRRNIKVIIQKAKESRNLFMTLNNSGAYRDRIKLIRERAQFFQKLQYELTSILKTKIGQEKKVSLERHKTSFYNINLLQNTVSQKTFYNIIEEGDSNCLSILKDTLKEKNIPKSINRVITNLIENISTTSLNKVRFIPGSLC